MGYQTSSPGPFSQAPAPATSAAVAGMSPATGMIGAAGLGAIAQLFAGIMQKEELERQRKAQEKAAAEALAYQREKDSKDRLQSAQHDQLSIIKSNGEGQQGALNNLMAMLARAQR